MISINIIIETDNESLANAESREMETRSILEKAIAKVLRNMPYTEEDSHQEPIFDTNGNNIGCVVFDVTW